MVHPSGPADAHHPDVTVAGLVDHAARRPAGDVPAPVLAAEALVVVLSALLLAVGVACLPLAPVEARYAVVGLGLAGISVLGFRVRRRLQTPDPASRTLISGLMAGDVVAVLLGTDGSFTGPLFIPLAAAVSVVALLWVPRESQSFFGSGPSLGRGAGDSSADAEAPHPDDPEAEPRPEPARSLPRESGVPGPRPPLARDRPREATGRASGPPPPSPDRHPPGRHPLRRHPPGRHPPGRRVPGRPRARSRRHPHPPGG